MKDSFFHDREKMKPPPSLLLADKKWRERERGREREREFKLHWGMH